MKVFNPWLTPKIFGDFTEIEQTVQCFYDHYADYIRGSEKTVINFCTGNGDHILNYAGMDDTTEFDWARYNRYVCDEGVTVRDHNLGWLKDCYEPQVHDAEYYPKGPSFLTSDKRMNNALLLSVYRAFYKIAKERGINVQILEYLEPGPEFCDSVWKRERHPECLSNMVIDVCAKLKGDEHRYSAYPDGIAEGTPVSEFIARQCRNFVHDFGIDGICLGNQFGLLGFWDPNAAPPLTQEREEAIGKFFRTMRSELDGKLLYWMDSYHPVETEISVWGMRKENYACLDGIIVSSFAVLVKEELLIPNIQSKRKVCDICLQKPDVLFTMDFVDPWYQYRVYVDYPDKYEYQRQCFEKVKKLCDGVSFFANDTFGLYVFEKPLRDTLKRILQ